MGGGPPTQSWLYKGIALFTPAFDLVYGLDVTKQGRWHHQLCSVLQSLLDLPEPPLFLCPGLTASVDIWLDEGTQQLCIAAEAYPLVWSQRPILDALFGRPEFPHLPWQQVISSDAAVDSLTLESYRPRFPQLWESHNLLYGLELQPVSAPPSLASQAPTCLLRLYISGHSTATAQTLKTLHALLPRCLDSPYTLKVIDVTRQPDYAEADQVTATPTLVRVLPHPRRQLVGKLDDLAKLQWLLGRNN